MRPFTVKFRLALVFALGMSLLGVQLAAAQAPSATTHAAALSIGGDVAHPLALTLADLKAMPRTTVKVDDHGTPIAYEGVLIGDLLARAGAPVGRDLTGKALATYVKATASDGYEVVFSLAELDPAMTSSEIIVADTADGKALSDAQGPLKIVTPHDKRAARGAHMLIRLDVVRVAK